MNLRMDGHIDTTRALVIRFMAIYDEVAASRADDYGSDAPAGVPICGTDLWAVNNGR